MLGASGVPGSEQEQPPFQQIPEILPNDDDFIFRDDDVICEPNDVHGVAPVNSDDVGIENGVVLDNAQEVDIESANEFGSENQDLSIDDDFEHRNADSDIDASDLEPTPTDYSLSPLFQSDTIEDDLKDELQSIQSLENDFVQESHQLASELNDAEALSSHLYDETVSESRSADDDTITNDELRSAKHDTITNDEERSKKPPPPPLRSEHYNL